MTKEAKLESTEAGSDKKTVKAPEVSSNRRKKAEMGKSRGPFERSKGPFYCLRPKKDQAATSPTRAIAAIHPIAREKPQRRPSTRF